jgi:5'-nucleotidase
MKPMTESSRVHLLLTNDDGPQSLGLRALISELRPHYELVVCVPSRPRSGISKAVTFDKPLRFGEGPMIDGQRVIETSGTPADAVTWGRTYHPRVKLVVSGLNLGLNVSLHSMLTSGTVGAAIEAALWSIPAIALSIETDSQNWFFPMHTDANVTEAAHRAHRLIDFVLEHGLPHGVDLFNVNFPGSLDSSTPTDIACPTRIRFSNRLQERADPQRVQYYWVKGKPIRRLAPTCDVYAATTRLHAVITPVSIALADDALVETTRDFLKPVLKQS